MDKLRVSDDLTIEVHVEDPAPFLTLRSQGQQSDDPGAGVVIIWPGELRALVEALALAAGELAELAAARLDGPKTATHGG